MRFFKSIFFKLKYKLFQTLLQGVMQREISANSDRNHVDEQFDIQHGESNWSTIYRVSLSV